MRARTAIAGARPGARLTAAGCAALAILATTTACSTPSGTAAAGTTSATASPTGSFFTARVPSSGPPASASASASPSPVQPTPLVPATQSASPVPVGAPSTGGGGTSGVQDILLFGLGGAALLAGAGSLAYRRRTLRDR